MLPSAPLLQLGSERFPFFAQRVDKIFRNMDRDKDAKLTYDEFVEGSKQDPTIVQVCRCLPHYIERPIIDGIHFRHYHYMTALCSIHPASSVMFSCA